MTTQFTPFELVFSTQPIMHVEFMIPIKRIRDVPIEDLNQAIHVRMEDPIQLDEKHWRVGDNINHIQLLQKENWDEKGKFKNICEGDLILWMPKSTKIKGGKFKLPWKGPYKICKAFNNNTIKLTTLGDDEVERVNINKLNEYHSKNMAIDIMVANVHVERCPSRYHQGRISIIVPKNLFSFVPKLRILPWTYFIPKIENDEYFWTKEGRSKSSERRARSGYKAKPFFFKIIKPYQLCFKRERL
jgi:hypothetical protein